MPESQGPQVGLSSETIRVPVAPGQTQPSNISFRFEGSQASLGIMILETTRELRTPLGSVDGILYTMPPPSGNKVTKVWTMGSKTVDASGTAEVLVASSTLASELIMMAKLVGGNNAGNVFWGDATLAAGSAEGPELAPGESFRIAAQNGEVFDLNAIYVDADTNDDGFVFMYLPA